MSPAATVSRAIHATAVIARLPGAERRATVRLIALGALVEVLLRTWPLPRVARLLGVRFTEADAHAHAVAPLVLTERDRCHLRCVRRIARHWRFSEGACLRASLLAGHVLRRHHPRLVIGVSRDQGAFAAHAWLDVQGRIIGDRGMFQRLA